MEKIPDNLMKMGYPGNDIFDIVKGKNENVKIVFRKFAIHIRQKWVESIYVKPRPK